MDETITAAFPASVTPIVQQLAPVLLRADAVVNASTFPVLCANETLLIPRRVYGPRQLPPENHELVAFGDVERTIIACWFSRHSGGRERERFLRLFTYFDTPLIISYVVALCGEYVIEILDYVWQSRNLFDQNVLGTWLRDNRPYYARTRRRIVSYWDCYYRSRFPRFDDYVGGQLLSFFDDCIVTR